MISARNGSISSHTPWTRIPRLIPWDQVGDGSIFNRIPPAASSRASLLGDSTRARKAYGQSIEYSLSTLFSFVQRYGNDNTVLVVLGDHQPSTVVSGQGASHDHTSDGESRYALRSNPPITTTLNQTALQDAYHCFEHCLEGALCTYAAAGNISWQRNHGTGILNVLEMLTRQIGTDDLRTDIG